MAIIGVSGKIGSGKEEEWKSCINYPYYEVSNMGNVRSTDKPVNSRGGSIAIKKGKVLALAKSNGYLTVNLPIENTYRTVGVHTLVAIAFVPNPNNLPIPNHKDGDKHNNQFTNLEWVTYSQNMYHASKNNLIETGERHYNAKLTDVQVQEIRDKYKLGTYSHSDLGKLYGVTKQNITMILNNKSRKEKI